MLRWRNRGDPSCQSGSSPIAGRPLSLCGIIELAPSDCGHHSGRKAPVVSAEGDEAYGVEKSLFRFPKKSGQDPKLVGAVQRRLSARASGGSLSAAPDKDCRDQALALTYSLANAIQADMRLDQQIKRSFLTQQFQQIAARYPSDALLAVDSHGEPVRAAPQEPNGGSPG